MHRPTLSRPLPGSWPSRVRVKATSSSSSSSSSAFLSAIPWDFQSSLTAAHPIPTPHICTPPQPPSPSRPHIPHEPSLLVPCPGTGAGELYPSRTPMLFSPCPTAALGALSGRQLGGSPPVPLQFPLAHHGPWDRKGCNTLRKKITGKNCTELGSCSIGADVGLPRGSEVDFFPAALPQGVEAHGAQPLPAADTLCRNFPKLLPGAPGWGGGMTEAPPSAAAQEPKPRGFGTHLGTCTGMWQPRALGSEISARDSLKPKSRFIGTIHDS